jgi:hypothetical protein
VLSALAVIAFGLAWRVAPDRRTTVEVDLTVPSTGLAMVVATTADGGYQQRNVWLEAGRNELSERLPLPFDTLRLLPLEVTGAEVVLHEVRVRQGDRDLLRFDAADLASWEPYNLTDLRLEGDGYHARVVAADAGAGLSVPVALDATEPTPTVASRLDDWFSDSWSTFTLTLALPLAVLLAAWARRRPILVVGALAASMAVVVAGAAVATGGVTPATQALGGAGWTGRDALYGTKTLAAAVAIAVTATIAAVGATKLLPRRRARPGVAVADGGGAAEPAQGPGAATPGAAAGEDRRPGAPQRRWRRALGRLRRVHPVVLVAATYALLRLPSVDEIVHDLVSGDAAQHWDVHNLRTWDALYAAGLRPMRDFWYPYGNLVVLSAGVVGPVLEWALDAAMFAVICLALRNLAGGRRLPAVLGAVLVAVVQLTASTGGARYVFPLAAVMWMASTRRTPGLQRWLALATVAAAPLLAVDVGLYALAGVAGAVVLDELSTREPLRARSRRLLVEGGAVLLGVVAAVVVLALRDQLRGNVDFVLRPGEVTAYTASVTPVSTLAGSAPAFVLLGLPLLFLSVALAGALDRARRPRPWIAVLGGTSAFSLLLVSKHLVRPGMEAHLGLAAAAGLATVLCAAAGVARPRVWHLAAGLLAGALVVQASADGLLRSVPTRLGAVPSELHQLVGAVTWQRAETPLLHAPFGPANLEQLPHELEAARQAEALRRGGRAFVLGDAQYLYPLLGTRPYWTISVYDTSPLRQQEEVLGLLAADPPSVVVVDRRDLLFDLVPNVVRVPLLYRWVVERYRPASSIGPFDLLVERGQAPVDWAYWREVLGTTLDLRRLPAAAGHSGAGPCPAAGPCVTYATARLDAVGEPTTRTLAVEGPSGTYTVTFEQWPGEDELHVPLGRLWFWAEGSTVQPRGGGWAGELRIERYEDRGFLY